MGKSPSQSYFCFKTEVMFFFKAYSYDLIIAMLFNVRCHEYPISIIDFCGKMRKKHCDHLKVTGLFQ